MFFIFIVYCIFTFPYNAKEVTAAVPIDIATDTPGHTYKPIMMFIPDKKPLISRRQRGRYDRDSRRTPRYDYDVPIHRNYYPYGHKHGRYYRVKYQDSFYDDDVMVPFLMADTWRKVPSVGHGVAIEAAQVLPIVKRMLTAGFFNNEVMQALKKWQYHHRLENRWKWRYRRKLIQSGKLKDDRWKKKGKQAG